MYVVIMCGVSFTYPQKATLGCQTISGCFDEVRRVGEEEKIPLSVIGVDVGHLVGHCTLRASMQLYHPPIV